MSLQVLNARTASCTRCLLHQNREHSVPGEGDPHARIMLVGEAPGSVENQTGRPFVGPSGQRLNAWLAAAGLTREAVYITNTVACQPLGNRDPTPEEMKACSPFLHTRILLIQPRVIVTVGKIARSAFKDPYVSPGGDFQCPVLSIVHPSYALRMELKDVDLGAIRTLQRAATVWAASSAS